MDNTATIKKNILTIDVSSGIINVIKLFILFSSWIFFVYYSQNDIKTFFATSVIYSAGFLYEFLNIQLSQELKIRKKLSASLLFLVFLYLLLSILGVSGILIAKDGILCADFIINDIHILRVDYFLLASIIMPACSFFQFGFERR